MAEKTIIYLTDNTLREDIRDLCIKLLLRESEGFPLISVSQEPMELGENINVGPIGKCWLSLYKQLHAGVEAVKTKYVTVAEHDCLYTREHFEWMPPRDDTFFYNSNHWLVQWGSTHPEMNHQYSFFAERYALSQLVVARDTLKPLLEKRLELLEDGVKPDGEFGVMRLRKYARQINGRKLMAVMKNFPVEQKIDSFKTENPNVDIRHMTNFSGPRRGKQRCYEIPFWGKFEDVIHAGV